MTKNPSISIVTIFLNEEKYIKDTLISLKIQEFKEFECILVDGGSVDRSTGIIKATIEDDKRFKLIYQKSRGISNAFKEGIQESRSNYLLFLNGGDLLATKDALTLMFQAAQENPNAIIAYRSEYLEEDGKRTGKKIPSRAPRARDLDWHCSLAHQSTLVPRELFERSGGYLPVFRVAMDYEMWLRAVWLGYQIKGYSQVTAYHRKGGVSSQLLSQSRKEVVLARWIHRGWLRFSLLKDLVQLILSSAYWMNGREKQCNRTEHSS